jgi:hypothetical protein
MTSEIIAVIISIIIVIVSIDVMTQKDMSGKFEGFTLYLIIKDAITDRKIKKAKRK